MKFIYCFFILFSFISCKNNAQSKAKSVNHSFLEKPWIKITEVKEEKVIYKPCDANNSEIIPNSKLKKITVKYGIENQDFDYKEVVFDDKTKSFKIKGVSYLGTPVKDIVYTKNNETESTWNVPNDVSIRTTAYPNQYKKVNESCDNETSSYSSIEFHKKEYEKIGFNFLFEKRHDINLDNIPDAFLVFENQSDKINLVVILRGIGKNNLEIWKQSKKLISNIADGCPAEGFERIVTKDGYFTIEEANCDGWKFISSYITFKYDRNLDDFLLHKYGIEYTDRRNPDKKIPDKTFGKKDFGRIVFKDFNNMKLPF